MELGEHDREVGHVTKRKTEAQEIEPAGKKRQLLGHPLHDGDVARPGERTQHTEARVDADHLARIADDGDGLAGHEPRADGNVQNVHARRQPGANERPAPIPGSGAPRHHPFDAVVVFRGVIEDLADERRATLLPIVILRK